MPRCPAVPDRLPVAATKTRRGFTGSTTILPIAPLSASPQRAQCRPPSVERYTPSPKNVRPPPDGLASPVPAHSVPSPPIVSAPIVCVAPVGHAVWKVAPASVLRHTPPPDAATYSVSARRGSTARSVTRPPMLVGPTSDHRPGVRGSARACAMPRRTSAGVTFSPEVYFSVR